MLKNKVSRVIALVATVCCLGGAAAGLTAFAVNSSISAKAVDTAYSGQEPAQQYVIRFKEPTGVRYYVGSGRSRVYFDTYSTVNQPTLETTYGIKDIKPYMDSDYIGKGKVYDVATDGSTELGYEFGCTITDADKIESLIYEYENGGTTSSKGGAYPLYEITFTNWDNGITNDHLPIVTMTPVYQTVTYNVIHNSGNGFTFTGDEEATAGKNYNFTVVAHDGYSITSVKYTVNSANEKDALGSNGSYVIPANDVTGEINITVTAEARKYTVTFTDPTGAHFEKKGSSDEYERIEDPLSLSTVESAGTTFRLVAEEGYTVGNAKVYQGRTALTKVSGDATYQEYTLQSVTADVTVSASGVAQKTYTVTTQGSGVSFSGLPSGKVAHGSSLTFTVNVTEGGKEIDTVTYTMGEGQESTTLTSPNNTYTILNVTGDVTISVTLKATQYSITFPSKTNQRGYTITKDGENTPLAGLVTKEYGELKFKIELMHGYTGTPEVTFVPTSGQAQTLQIAEGVYTLNVNSNGTINVDGITQEMYTVTVDAEELTHYHYTPSGSTTNLTYGSTFHFTVEADNGYSFNGYTIEARKGEEAVVVTPAAGSKQKTNFSFTVEGNVTVTIKEKADAAQTFTVFSDSSNTHCTIKVGENVLGTEDNDKVKFNSQFSFTVEAAEGYTVTGVYAGDNSVPFRNGQYTITVTGNVTLHVTVQENTLTVTYMNSSGEPSSPQNYTYTQLVSGVQVPSTDTYALGGPFTYLVARWYKDGILYTDQQFASSLIATASTSITLNCRYDFNTEKSAELLGTFTAKYRDDNEGADGWSNGKSYLIVKLAIDGEEWKLFLDELNTLGASLTAVGFTYSNAPNGVLSYTDKEISDKIADMTLATGDGSGKADEKTGAENAVLRLYGYRWERSSLTQENQVQFISGINVNATRYVGGWFAVTINGVRTVIQSNLEKVAGTPAAKKATVEAVLTESAPTDESYEEPTIE